MVTSTCVIYAWATAVCDLLGQTGAASCIACNPPITRLGRGPSRPWLSRGNSKPHGRPSRKLRTFGFTACMRNSSHEAAAHFFRGQVGGQGWLQSSRPGGAACYCFGNNRRGCQGQSGRRSGCPRPGPSASSISLPTPWLKLVPVSRMWCARGCSSYDIADAMALGQVHGEVFGQIRPASTLVEVSRLIDPALSVEIEADAIAGSGGADAVILAGGKAKRMGRDKSRIRLGSRMLLGHARAAVADAGLEAESHRHRFAAQLRAARWYRHRASLDEALACVVSRL